jgi:electron transfer flavoprotein beta subunit
MKPHVIVCIKSVIMQLPGAEPIRSAESCELNPFDRPALEVALQIRKKDGGTVTALCMGPESSASSLYEAMAMGVDRGVLVCDPALAGSDTLVTSTVLANAIKKLTPFNLLFFGTRSADSDTGQVGPQTALLLDLPFVGAAISFERKDTRLYVEHRTDGFREKFELSLPGALTIHPGSLQPRDVGLLGIEAACEEGNLEKWSLEDIGLSQHQVGLAGSPTRVLALSRVERVKECEFISGSAEEQADELVRRLVESGFAW